MASFKNKTWQGIQWSLGSQLVNQIMVLVINLALLRWLSPQDFGLFAFPYLVFSFFRSFHDFGYGDVLIVKKEWNILTYASIFWLTMVLALVSSLLMVLLAPWLASWTRNSLSEPLLFWLALALILGSVQAGLEVVFRKKLLFKNLFWMEFYANLVSGIVALWMAWQGYGIYALIGKTLVYVSLLSVMAVLRVPEKPRFLFSLTEVKSHLSFATANIGDQLVQFVFKNVDTFLLSRYAAAAQLGWYDRAFKLLVFPVQQAGASVARVVMPAFSAFGDDKQKMAAAYLKLMGTAALMALPVLATIPVIAGEGVKLLFDPSWRPLASLFGIFTLMAFAQGVFALGNPVFYLSGKVTTLLRFSLVSRTSAVLVLLWAVFTAQDIQTIALSFSLAAFVFVVPFQHIVLNLLSIAWIQLWEELKRPVLASVIMVIALVVTRSILGPATSIFALTAKVGAAWFVYGWVVRKDLSALFARL